MSLLTLELLVAAAAATVILGIVCLAFSAEIKVLRTSNRCLLEIVEEEWATSRALRAERNRLRAKLAEVDHLIPKGMMLEAVIKSRDEADSALVRAISEIKMIHRTILAFNSAFIPTPERGYTAEPHMIECDFNRILRKVKEDSDAKDVQIERLKQLKRRRA